MVHGSEEKPEYMLNAPAFQAAKTLMVEVGKRADTLSLMDSFINDLQANLSDTQNSIINKSTNSSAVVIESATVQMNIKELANDYDARRAGDQVMEEILRIASKSGTRSV